MAESRLGPACVKLGPVDQISPGQGRCFLVAGREVAVFRQRDGKLFATDNRCPHRQGPLSEGLLGGGKVICPLHAHTFDLATGKGPNEQEMLRVYAVREEGGQLLLEGEADPGGGAAGRA
jgi:nitrite reductase (NADH) small subunit